MFVFFFQAEDGIRDGRVTGVQTCALPISIVLAFLCMIVIGFFLDHRIFQVPASASILILFALLNALVGALSYFMRSWSILFVMFLFVILNLLYKYDIIDPRNKAFGLDYSKTERPAYTLKGLEA